MFAALPRTALADEIVAHILHLIQSGSFQPGDRLPPEREMAAMLGVSRPSLREALRALSIMHVVELRHGSGAYVTSLEPDLLVEHLDFVFTLTDMTYLQVFQARKILEPGICALAATTHDDDEMTAIEAAAAKAHIGLADVTAYYQADAEMHDLIAHATHNPLLRRYLGSLRRLGLQSRARTSLLPGIVTSTLADHEAILSALRQRDAVAAHQAMWRHLDHVEQRLIQAQNDEA